MARKKQLIIPVFIPFAGCPNRCVYCDQEGITGRAELPSTEEVIETIRAYLSTWKGKGRREVAFYGGTFTSLPVRRQEAYLGAARRFLLDGSIDGLRVSTRPDSITEEGLRLLAGYGVTTVELGVQSMSDRVLRLSGRGHASLDTVRSVALLKKSGMRVGLQLMPGLPGDDEETILATAREAIRLSPDFVRIYPALVIRDTPLERMMRQGLYRPWGLHEMASVCKTVLKLFREALIPVVRIGLHNSEELRRSIVAGPYHPSFRNLVEGLQNTLP